MLVFIDDWFGFSALLPLDFVVKVLFEESETLIILHLLLPQLLRTLQLISSRV